jgi:hypothetical protein
MQTDSYNPLASAESVYKIRRQVCDRLCQRIAWRQGIEGMQADSYNPLASAESVYKIRRQVCDRLCQRIAWRQGIEGMQADSYNPLASAESVYKIRRQVYDQTDSWDNPLASAESVYKIRRQVCDQKEDHKCIHWRRLPALRPNYQCWIAFGSYDCWQQASNPKCSASR